MDESFPCHVEAIENIMEGLSASEKDEVIQLLKKLGGHAKQLS